MGFANNNTSISVARWGLVCVSANSDLATVATSGVASLVFDDLAPGISADSFSTFGKVQELFSISLAACAVLNGSLVRMMLDERLLESTRPTYFKKLTSKYPDVSKSTSMAFQSLSSFGFDRKQSKH